MYINLKKIVIDGWKDAERHGKNCREGGEDKLQQCVPIGCLQELLEDEFTHFLVITSLVRPRIFAGNNNMTFFMTVENDACLIEIFKMCRNFNCDIRVRLCEILK